MPSTFKQQQYMVWKILKQGTKTVVEYIQEREKLIVLCDINEPEEMKIGGFLGGLRGKLGKNRKPPPT